MDWSWVDTLIGFYNGVLVGVIACAAVALIIDHFNNK